MTDHDWICPGCGLLCDDITLPVHSEIQATPCQRARRWLETAASCAVRSIPHPPDWQRAVSLLREAVAPVIVLGDTDVETARAALALADQHLASVRLDQSPCSDRIDRFFGRSSHFTLTLGEVRARADLVVLLNPKLDASGTRSLPRLFDKFLTAKLPDGTRREILAIGGEGSSAHLSQHLPCPVDGFADLFSRLMWRLNPKSIARELPDEAVSFLLELLAKHRYIAWVWHDEDLPQPAESFLTDLVAITTALNADRLSGSLRLHARPGLLTASQVCTWQTGVAPPVTFTRAGPDANRMLDWDAFDLMIRVNPLDAIRTPLAQGKVRSPQIVIAPAYAPLPQDVHLPAAIPGWHTSGYLVRGDTALTSKLKAASPQSHVLPHAGEVLQQLSRDAQRKVR